MTDSESRRWLYDQAKNKGVDLGDYDAFDKAMDDANNRKWVYDQATQKGLDLGDYDAYDKAIGPAQAPKSTAKQKTPPISDIRNPKNPNNPMNQPDDFTPPEGMDWETNPDTAVAETTSVAKPQIQDPIRTSYNPISNEEEITSPYQAMFEDLSRVNAINQELERARARKNRTAGAYQIEEEAYGPVLPRNNSFQKQAKDDVKRLEAEKKQLMAKLDMNPEYRQHITDEADAVVEKKNEALEALEALGPADSRMIIGGPGLPPMPSFTSDQTERDDLDAALRLYDDAEKMLRSPFKYDDSNGWANHFKGVGDRIKDPDFWTMGLTEIVDLVALRNVLKKVENEADRLGEKGIEAMTEDDADLSFLSPGEQALFDAFFTNLNARRMRADDMSSGYKSGQTAADSAKFMVEMGYSGVVGKAASKGMTKYLTKKLASRLVNMNSKSLGYKLGKEVGGWGIKKAGDVVATVAGLPLTPEMPLGTLRRATELDDNGRLPDIDLKLVANGTLDSGLEYFTERGSVIADGLKAFGKIVPVKQWASSFLSDGANDFLRSLSRTDMARLMKQGAWNGFVDEGLEEFDNAVYDYLRGNPDAISDFMSVDNLLELSASFAGMSVMGTAVSTAQAAKVNFDYNRAEKDLRDMMAKKGYSEDQIQHIIDIANGNSSLSDLGGALTMVVNGQPGAGAVREMKGRLGTTTEEFKVVKDYMDAAAKRTAIRGIQGGEQDARIEQERESLLNELGGHRFWQGRFAEGRQIEGSENSYLEYIDAKVVMAQVHANPNAGLQEGQMVFLTSTPDPQTGEMGYVTEDGKTGFIKADGIAPMEQNGTMAMAIERPLREYLSYRVMANDAQVEQEDFNEQRQKQVDQLSEQYKREDKVTIDGKEGEISAVTPDGIQVDFPADNAIGMETKFFTWEEVAQKQGTPMQVRTEEEEIAGELGEQEALRQNEEKAAQIVKDNADKFTTVIDGATYTLDSERPIVDGSVAVDGTARIRLIGPDGKTTTALVNLTNLAAAQTPAEKVHVEETPQEPQYEIPRTKDGEIDYDKLMEENPAEFARVNDEEMQDNGESTKTLFKNRVAELQKELKKNQENLAKQSKPSEMKKYQRKVADIQDKIANLQSVLDSYNVAAQAPATPVAEQPVAPVAEAPAAPAPEVVETPAPAPAPEPAPSAGRTAKFKAKRYTKLLSQLGDPLDFMDYAMRIIAGDSIRFKWKADPNHPNIRGLGDLFGYSATEQKKHVNILRDADGLYLDKAIETIFNAYAEEKGVDVDKLEIGLEQAAQVVEGIIRRFSVKEMVDEIKRRHAEADYDPMQDEDYAQGMMEAEAAKYGMTIEEYQDFAADADDLGVGTDELFERDTEDGAQDLIIEKLSALSEDEWEEYENQLADEYIARQIIAGEEAETPGDNSEDSEVPVDNETDGEQPVAGPGEAGPAVLQGEQPTDGGVRSGDEVGRQGAEGEGRDSGSNEVPGGSVRGGAAEAAEEVADQPVPESADVENIPEMPEELQEEAAEAEAEEEQPVAEEETPQQEEFVPTEEQIRNANIPEELKTMAIAYLNGDRSFANTIAYQNALIEIQKNAGDSTQAGAADSSDAGSAQVDSGTDETPSTGSGQRGASSGDVAGEGGAEDVSGNDGRRSVRGRKNRPSHGVPASGEQGDNGVAGGEPGLFDQPADSGRPDVGSTNRGAGRDVRGEEAGGNGSAGAGETVQRGTDARPEDIDSEIDALKGELSDLWKDFTKAGQANLSLSIVGMNGQQIQILGKILATSARLGYQFLKKGIRSLQNFRNKLREVIGDPLKKVVGYSDAEIDEFINEIWDAPYTMDGETHKISEWASIIGKEELRNEMRRTIEEKRELQKQAESVPVKIADEDNIRESLPFLLPEQREDVRRAEVQFFDESHNDRDHAFGKGYMFTNGTGTGKTYTGLGIAKRFIKQGKPRILILTPSQEKVSDWVRDAGNLQIELTRLDDTKDKGTGPVITTYANFRQNKALLEDTFDLVIYDESHRIMENKEGEPSIGTKMHYMLSNRNADAALERLQATHPLWIKDDELMEDIKAIEDKISKSEDYGEIATLEAELTKKQVDLDAVRAKEEEELPALKQKAAESVPKTKVVFLSATPFNTVQNLEYAEGYIFTYPEENEATKGTSRHKTAKEEFMEKWFGSMISYKGGKQVESIENEDAVTKQEVAFSDYLQNTLQTMNGRIIDSEYDYSRDFPLVEVSMANEFNAAMEDIKRDPVMKIFNENDVNAFGHLDDYNWSTFLFEAMKVSALLPRIREHLARGRKLVIFHRRINAPGQRVESEEKVGRGKKTYPPMQPPFALGLQQAMEFAANTRDTSKAAKVMLAVQRFKEKYGGLLQWEQTLDYRSVREQLIDAFATDEDRKKFAEEHEKWEKKAAEARKTGKKEPAEPTLKASRIGLFSGQESKGAKHKDVEDFNSDEGKDILVVQESSGKEGISLHDQTGTGHQRVLISMAMPQSPITFIQIEGRIYRIGNMSNAIFEYPLLGINKELQLFAGKFNGKAGTTENLALGSLGRGLKRAIAEGVIEHMGVIPLDGQGIGGKEWDARQSTDGGKTGYDGAISDYYTNVKKKPGREDREGVDYFPTPEPIGFKMVEWAKIGDGESVLEPSAGHGAIARYVPTANELTAIEPSQALNARLAILIGGGNRTIKESEFEDYNIINKHDVVVMNPPYGTAGKTAGEHLEKAFDHLNEGGRLIAIIPDGPAMDKRVEKWSGEHPEAVVVGEVKLPSVAFDRAGTSVRTRILVIDKVSRAEARKTVPEKQTYDFSDVEKIDDLFEKMRHVNMPERTIDQIAIKMRAAKRSLTEFKKIKDIVREGELNKVTEEGLQLDIAKKTQERLYIPYDGYEWDHIKGDSKWHLALKFKFEDYANLSDISPRSQRMAQKYAKVLRYLEMDRDETFATAATNAAWRMKDEDIEPLRQFYKLYLRLFRDLSGLTEAQILRVADGLSPDISPADISGELTMDSLREKFDVANGENEERKELFNRVFAVAKQLGLNINVYRSNGDDVANYNIADNSLNINALKWNKVDNDFRAQTILHEMIHAVTCYYLYLDQIQRNGAYISAEQERIIDELMTPEVQAACADINSVYRLIMTGEESREFAGKYGLFNAREMIAELANTSFRAKLKARNLWKRIVNGIKRLLGFESENAEQTTAEKEVLAALDTLLDNFTPEAYERARSVVNNSDIDDVVSYLEVDDFNDKETQSEADVIYAKAMLDGSLGIAPNGKKSNLDPEQWALVRTDRFKGFFGDWVNDSKNASKVVDENGEPRVVYHGTKHKFWTFDGGKSRARYTDGLNYFALDKQFAEDWIHRDDDWQRDPEDTEKIENARLRSLEHKREVSKPIFEKYGDKYWDTDEYRELEKEFDQWERDNLDLDGMTVKEARYNFGKRLLGCFINARNPFNPTEMYDTVGKEMLQRLGVLEQNPQPMSEYYARGGAYIYYERKDVIDELKRLGYDGIYLSENVWSDPSKNLRTIAVWDSNRIKLAEPTTYDDNGNEIPIDDRFSENNDDIRFRIREEEPPTKTGIGYKVFYLKNGNLYPPMVANPNGAATPVGVWLDADAAPVAETSKTGRSKVKAGGRGTQGGSGTLAYRPGWHLGEIPYALQFNRVNPETGEKELFPKDFVWAEVEYADDVDYQDEAMSYGMTPSGKFQHSLAGLPRVPENGSYHYRTNPNPETDPWIITGAMKVNRILTQDEVDQMVRDAGREPQKKQPGGVTNTQIAELNQKIAEAARNDTDSIESRVTDTAQKLGVNVRLVNQEELNGETDKRKRRSKGWFDPKTEEIVVVVPNAESAADAEATVLHEVVGHYGLRKLFGDNFDKTLETLRGLASKEIRDEVSALAKRLGVSENVALEEYLAQLAENGATDNEELSFWEKAKAFIRSLFRSIGIDMGEITEADLNYLIWASRRNLEQSGGDLLRAADNAIIRSAMKQMAQDSHDVQRETPTRLYRNGDTSDYAKAVIARQYEKRIASSRYQFREAMQDSMLSLRDFMLSTLKAEGKDTKFIEDVPGFENAYLSENALSSKTKIEQDTFGKLLFEPLVNEIAQLANTAEERQELTDYMMAKHGLERNEKFAQRDAIRFYKNIMDATIEAAKKDKSLDDQARADAIDKAEQEFEAHKTEVEAKTDKKYKEFRKQDYSGLTALTQTDNVADAEAKATDMVHDYEFDHDTDELWKKTKDVTSAIMKKMGEGGIVTRTAAKEITDTFEFYIPLRGFDETTSDEAYAYLDDAHGPLNSPILRAEGRESKADDPIATLANMADTAIMQANRNEMKQKFLNFVLNHPTDLVSVNDLWIQFNDVTGEWEAVFADIKEGDAPAIVDQKVQDFEQHMQELAEQEPDKYKKAKDAKNIPYRVINGHLKEHQILIKRLGKTYVLTVNGNPRLAQALNGETNPDAQTKGVLGAVGRIAKSATTTLSQLYTTRNPEFIASNFMRDAIYANSMAWIKENPKYAANFNKNFGRVNPARMLSLLSKFEKNELDMSNPVEKAFQEFMMNGGETGYTNVKDIEKQKKEIGKQIKKMQGRMPIAKAMDVLGDEMDLLNRAVENCARFAAFLTSREQGRDLERSIYDAKEISVNFNKKGAGDRFYRGTGQTWWGNAGAFMSGAGREFYAFWNAGLQGTTNFARAAKRHPYKFGFGAAAMFTIGALMPMMYQYLFGGDDDDKDNYYNLPEYVRRSNICFKAGDKWITIPLPIEMRALYGLGELAAGQMMGQEGYDAQEFAYQLGSQVSQVLPLDMLEGGGGLHALIPTGIKPVAEAYMNKKWTGLPLYQQKSQWNEDMPEWTKAFKSANPLIVNMTAALNGITAEYGDKYEKGVINLNPARIEYMLNGYFGGYATTAQALVKMAEMGIDREWDWSNALIARRFLKSADETTEYRKLNNEYYELRDEYEHVKKQLKRYETNEDTERQNKLEASDKYKRYEIMAGPSSIDGDKSYYQKIDELNRAMKNAEDPEDAVELEKEKYDLIRDLMKEIHALDKKEKGKD